MKRGSVYKAFQIAILLYTAVLSYISSFRKDAAITLTYTYLNHYYSNPFMYGVYLDIRGDF